MIRTLTLFAMIFIFSGVISAQTRSGTWLKGTWSGTGYQIDNNETWTMRLTVTGRKYSIAYPSLKCGGVWKLVNIGSSIATFKELITYGKDLCTDRGKVTIERLSSRQINFRYANPGKPEITASAILKKGSQ